MGIEDILKAIATLGFPIVAAGGLGWFYMRQSDAREARANAQAEQDRKDAKERETRMVEQVDAMEQFQRTTLISMQMSQANAISQNTVAMQKNTEMLCLVSQKLDKVACLSQPPRQ